MNTVTVVLLALAGVCVALPQRPPVPVISRVDSRDASGQFTSSYQTGDGALVQETGKLKPTLDGRDMVLVKQGSYSYTSPEGVPVAISYTADEYGFNAAGDAIPVAPVETAPVF